MLSRIADSLYWMSRYLERADNTARLVEINLLHLLEAEDALPEAAQWRPLLSISGSEEAYAQAATAAREITARARHPVHDPRAREPELDPRQPAPRARERARGARPHLEGDVGGDERAVAAHRTALLDGSAPPERSPALYAEVRNGVARFHGLTVEHDDARRGLRLLPARHLPRARRHDRAHPRREVPPAAARPVAGRLAARLLPVGGAAEVAVGLRGLPAPATTPAAPDRRRRVRDLRARLPALAALRGRPHAAGAARRSAPPSADAPSARAVATLARPAREQRRRAACSSSGLHEFLEEFLERVSRAPRRAARRVLRGAPRETRACAT